MTKSKTCVSASEAKPKQGLFHEVKSLFAKRIKGDDEIKNLRFCERSEAKTRFV